MNRKEKILGFVIDPIYNALSENEKRKIIRWRSIGAYINKMEATIKKNEKLIKKLNAEINERKIKINKYNQERDLIFHENQRFTNDYVPKFRVQANNKKGNVYFNFIFDLMTQFGKKPISKYLGSKNMCIKILKKYDPEISTKDLVIQARLKDYIMPYIQHQMTNEFQNFIEGGKHDISIISQWIEENRQ
jgi:hypothetical protein